MGELEALGQHALTRITAMPTSVPTLSPITSFRYQNTYISLQKRGRTSQEILAVRVLIDNINNSAAKASKEQVTKHERRQDQTEETYPRPKVCPRNNWLIVTTWTQP